MKQWGLGRWGPLLAVLTLLVSAGVFLPLTAQAQGKKVWGIVTDCANTNPVGASVFLVDAHARLSDLQTTASTATGFYSFSDPSPSYYKVRIQPTGFVYFTNESAVFRFDGTVNVRVDVCVDRMPDRNRWLNLTVVDAQPAAVNGTVVTFQEFNRGPENATNTVPPRFDNGSGILQLDTKPLKWYSEILTFVDGSRPFGRRLTLNTEYTYSTASAFAGQIQITDLTVRNELSNTLSGGSPKGWLTVTYTNVSQSSRLQHGQLLSSAWSKNGSALTPPLLWNTLSVNNATGLVTINGNWNFQIDSLTVGYDWQGAIAGATVTVLERASLEPISGPLTTNDAGQRFTRVWTGGTFDVKVEADTYQTVVRPYGPIAGDTVDTIAMYKAWVIRVVAIDEDINPVLASQGLTGVLVNTSFAVRPEVRILPGQAQDNQVLFWASNGDYLLIVDANGKTAYSQNITVNGRNQTLVAELRNSPQELFSTAIAFAGNNDWNNLTVYRNITLLPDSVFPTIPNTNLRNLAWQLDIKFGTVIDGNIADAIGNLTTYVRTAGPFYVVTNSFFTVNSRTYKSDANVANRTVSATPQGTNLTIFTSQRYTLSDTTKWLKQNQSKYFVNVTTIADQNASVYQNYSFVVNLPKGYEMTSKTTSGNVATRRFTNVTVDPGVDASPNPPRANMVAEKSLTGVARAEVEGPAGKVSVQNSDQAKYSAWVANDTAIIFSANKTTDRSNQAINVKDANFTWTFRQDNLTEQLPKGYGIWTTHNFTNAAGNYTVHLQVTQVNPANVTSRWINVKVDNRDPVAVIKTNRTSVDNPPPFTINEDLQITFIGTNSTDELYTGSTEKGKVADWSWDFESDGTISRFGPSVSNWNYSTPGIYNATLFVTDSVGHKSANVTMQFTVKDVTPPTVDFVILDPGNGWRETPAIVEGKPYWFNASRTSDNSLKHAWDNVNLTYTFNWGDGTNATAEWQYRGSNRTLNVTHTYGKFGTNYTLKINATDASGNHGWLNRTQIVQANTTARPDLGILAGTLKVEPSNPEEGATVTFSVNFTNAKGRANATQLKVLLTMVVSGTDTNQTISGEQWLKPDGSPLTILEAGKNGTVRFTWAAPGVGNKSLTIKVWDLNEPDTLMGGNSQTTSLAVKEAGWKFWAIVGGFIFVVFGLPILYYVVRKVRAGDWELRRRRKKGDEDEEDEEEEEEEDEKEERGKKRL